MTLAPNTPFGVVAIARMRSRYSSNVAAPRCSSCVGSSSTGERSPRIAAISPSQTGARYSRGCRARPATGSSWKYSSGCPATPVAVSRSHRSVLPLRGVAQMRYGAVVGARMGAGILN